MESVVAVTIWARLLLSPVRMMRTPSPSTLFQGTTTRYKYKGSCSILFLVLEQVRASSARERQVWVDRLRHCIYQHSRTEEDEPARELSLPLTSIDAFGSVRDELEKVYERQEEVCQYIESLPVPRPDDSLSPSCHNPRLLQVKATSQAIVSCLQSASETLQQVAEHQIWLSGGAGQ